MNFIYKEIGKVASSAWERFTLSFEYYRYKFLFSMFRLYLNMTWLIQDEKNEQLNASQVFAVGNLH